MNIDDKLAAADALRAGGQDRLADGLAREAARDEVASGRLCLSEYAGPPLQAAVNCGPSGDRGAEARAATLLAQGWERYESTARNIVMVLQRHDGAA